MNFLIPASPPSSLCPTHPSSLSGRQLQLCRGGGSGGCQAGDSWQGCIRGGRRGLGGREGGEERRVLGFTAAGEIRGGEGDGVCGAGQGEEDEEAGEGG